MFAMAWIVRENRAREVLRGIRVPRPHTHETRPDVCFNLKTTELPRGSEMTRCANQRHSRPMRQLADQVLISGFVNSAACNLTKSYMLIGFWPVSLNRSSVMRS